MIYKVKDVKLDTHVVEADSFKIADGRVTFYKGGTPAAVFNMGNIVGFVKDGEEDEVVPEK